MKHLNLRCPGCSKFNVVPKNEHRGGTIIGHRQIQVGRQELAEAAYGWEDLRKLIVSE